MSETRRLIDSLLTLKTYERSSKRYRQRLHTCRRLHPCQPHAPAPAAPAPAAARAPPYGLDLVYPDLNFASLSLSDPEEEEDPLPPPPPPPRPAPPDEEITEEEKEFIRSRRRVGTMVAEHAAAAAAAFAAAARERWAAAGGQFQSHPDIPRQDLREVVEGQHLFLIYFSFFSCRCRVLVVRPQRLHGRLGGGVERA